MRAGRLASLVFKIIGNWADTHHNCYCLTDRSEFTYLHQMELNLIGHSDYMGP